MRFEAAQVLEVLYGQDEDQRRLFRRLVAAAGRRAHAFEQLAASVAVGKVGRRHWALGTSLCAARREGLRVRDGQLPADHQPHTHCDRRNE
jgi:hypothetical protein